MKNWIKHNFDLIIYLLFCLLLVINIMVISIAINNLSKVSDNEPKIIYVTVPVIEQVNEITDTEVKVEEPEIEEWLSLGEFTLTAYCPCEKCCGKCDGITSTGTHATQGRTIAVDPNVIPYGTCVKIDGHEYIAEDCGGVIVGKCIDVFFDNHDEALEFGIQKAEVFIKNESTVYLVTNSPDGD